VIGVAIHTIRRDGVVGATTRRLRLEGDALVRVQW
jgi:hypothetical protein